MKKISNVKYKIDENDFREMIANYIKENTTNHDEVDPQELVVQAFYNDGDYSLIVLTETEIKIESSPSEEEEIVEDTDETEEDENT